MTARRCDGFSAPGVDSRSASIGSTFVARRAGTSAATTVTTVPTSSETTMVRGSSCSEVLGRPRPTASISDVEALGDAEPEAEPDRRGGDAEHGGLDQQAAHHLAPAWRRSARSSAISRDRWVTIIVKVFQMMKEPTNSAMPAKTMNRIPTILKFSLMASEFSSATVLPVTASVPVGDHGGQPLGERGLATRRPRR